MFQAYFAVWFMQVNQIKHFKAWVTLREACFQLRLNVVAKEKFKVVEVFLSGVVDWYYKVELHFS